MQETKKKKRAVALFVIVLICLCGWWAVRKEGFFLDEIYSYGLANSSYVPFLSWLHGGEQVANGKLPEAVFTQSEFLNYVAPQGSTRFDYASVYYNQTQDVHPPLFYFLLHTVCSLFPGSFTKWTGLGMNFVLLGGTLAALYALGMELFADWKKALFVCALYAGGLWQFVTAEQVEQITAQNMETAWNVARQGGYEDVSLLATQEFEQIFVLKK